MRAADETARLWDARCVCELERVEADARAAHLRAERLVLEEAGGDERGSDESEKEDVPETVENYQSEEEEVLAVFEQGDTGGSGERSVGREVAPLAEVPETEQRVDAAVVQASPAVVDNAYAATDDEEPDDQMQSWRRGARGKRPASKARRRAQRRKVEVNVDE